MLPGLLALGGLGLGGYGLYQGLGGRTPTTTRSGSPYANQLLNPYLAAMGSMGPQAQGLYGQGTNLLNAMGQGQYPAGLAQLIERAFQPQSGDLYAQAAEQGRRRGFHDAPATSPPGGAVLGPGLAALQGQIAQAKLANAMQLANAYMQPGQNMAQLAAQGMGQAQGLGYTTRAPQPSAAQSIGAMSPFLLGLGNLFMRPEVQGGLGQVGSGLAGLGSGLAGLGQGAWDALSGLWS